MHMQAALWIVARHENILQSVSKTNFFLDNSHQKLKEMYWLLLVKQYVPQAVAQWLSPPTKWWHFRLSQVSHHNIDVYQGNSWVPNEDCYNIRHLNKGISSIPKSIDLVTKILSHYEMVLTEEGKEIFFTVHCRRHFFLISSFNSES